MSVATETFTAADEEAMVSLGGDLAAVCQPGLVIFLEGDLGLGKTTLSRGLIQGLGHRGAVKSPTYTLVEPYSLPPWQVYHFDLYRLGHPEELEFMGIRDYFGDFSVCLVEWPERGVGALPHPDLVITIQMDGFGRALTFCAESEQGRAVLAALCQRQAR